MAASVDSILKVGPGDWSRSLDPPEHHTPLSAQLSHWLSRKYIDMRLSSGCSLAVQRRQDAQKHRTSFTEAGRGGIAAVCVHDCRCSCKGQGQFCSGFVTSASMLPISMPRMCTGMAHSFGTKLWLGVGGPVGKHIIGIRIAMFGSSPQTKATSSSSMQFERCTGSPEDVGCT